MSVAKLAVGRQKACPNAQTYHVIGQIKTLNLSCEFIHCPNRYVYHHLFVFLSTW